MMLNCLLGARAPKAPIWYVLSVCVLFATLFFVGTPRLWIFGFDVRGAWQPSAETDLQFELSFEGERNAGRWEVHYPDGVMRKGLWQHKSGAITFVEKEGMAPDGALVQFPAGQQPKMTCQIAFQTDGSTTILQLSGCLADPNMNGRVNDAFELVRQGPHTR